MGFLSRALTSERKSGVYERWLQLLDFGHRSKAGPSVTVETALGVTTMLACARKLANGAAQVPFKLMLETQVNGMRNIRPATEHYLYDLMARRPNAWTTSFEFRETLVLHACFGNAYVFLNRYRGEIGELILLDPSKVRKRQNADYSIEYVVTGASGSAQVFPAEAIWHVRGPSWDGLIGLDVLKLAREAVGLAIATEQTHSTLHAKGVRPSGTYSVDGELDETQYAALKKWIDVEMAGAQNAGAPMILDRGAKWLSTAMNGVDSQHLETRKFQIEEMCRSMDVMPIMVGYSDKTATYASAEQMFLAHVIHTMSPWYARIEQSADAYLLTDKERKAGYYFNFVAAGLLRGASKDRAEYFKAALGAGGSPAWMAQDEVRALEELNPMGGDAGQLPKPLAAQPPPAPGGDPANP